MNKSQARRKLHRIPPQPPQQQITRFLELPHLWFLECVWCGRESPATEDLHNEEGKYDLDVVREGMGAELEIIATQPRKMGSEERRLKSVRVTRGLWRKRGRRRR